MTHSDKVNQHQSEAWPHGHEWRGHNPRKKNLLNLLCLALLARCANGHCWRQCGVILKRERRIHKLLLRQIQMDSDDKGDLQIPEIKYNVDLKQQEGKVRQALVLISPAFVETLVLRE